MAGASKPTAADGWTSELSPEGNRPVPTDGTYDLDQVDPNNIMGCHAGDYYSLNISYPQPGYAYRWARYERRGDQIRERQRGGVPVVYGDPEFALINALVEPTHAEALDDRVIFDELVLMRYPEERITRETEERLRANEIALKGAEAAFAAGASDAERASGSGRIRHRNHRLEYRSGGVDDGPLHDMWMPDDKTLPEG